LARETSCAACVLAASPTVLAPQPAAVAPPAIGETVAVHGVVRGGGAPTGEPYPTRGPPSAT
jgi:hypothetical protein